MVYLLHGGGLILVPVFTKIFHTTEKESRATSVFWMLPMVVASSVFYYQNKYFVIWLGIKCAIGGIIGGIIGAKLLNKMNNKYIKILFVIFLIIASIKLFK